MKIGWHLIPISSSVMAACTHPDQATGTHHLRNVQPLWRGLSLFLPYLIVSRQVPRRNRAHPSSLHLLCHGKHPGISLREAGQP
jgi:hypothetical protein